MKRLLKFTMAICIVFAVGGMLSVTAQAKKNVTVSPASLEAQARKHPSVYDKSVAHCMSLNEITESMRAKGGGTLTFKKGTYRFQYSVCIPSNVTVVFKDGVVIENIMDYHAHIAPTTLLFQFVPKNKSKQSKVIGKYNGTSNAKMIGKGKVVFKMNKVQGLAINVLHCKNIEISGITFKGMNGKHYIEVNASKKVNIHDCRFEKATLKSVKKNYVKEAINIDLPDPTIGGIGSVWAKQDKTPCQNITVKNCYFTGMSRGVGTHNYSQTKSGKNIYHKNITIVGNTFTGMYDAGINVLNWKNTKIINNTFVKNGIGKNKKRNTTGHAISGSGVLKITMTGNTFKKIKLNPVYFAMKENSRYNGKYKPIYVYITKAETQKMLDNASVDCGNDPGFPGYDIVYIKGTGRRDEDNAVGVNFEKQEINEKMKKTKTK